MAEAAPDFDAAVDNLERMAELMRELSIVVMNFRPESNETLMKKLTEITVVMQQLAKSSKEGLDRVFVPYGVIGDFIDQGLNPDLFLQRLVTQTSADRGAELSKVKQFKHYHRVLSDALSARYPDEMREFEAGAEGAGNGPPGM